MRINVAFWPLLSLFLFITACNVLVTEDQSLFTLNNNGMARNCSLTAVLSPPNLKLVQFGIGEPMPDDGLKSLVSLKPISNTNNGVGALQQHYPKEKRLTAAQKIR